MSDSSKKLFRLSRRGSLTALLGTGLFGLLGKTKAEAVETGGDDKQAKPPQQDIFKPISF